MRSRELTCQELVEVITDYLEGALPAGDALRFEEHLRGCRGCRTYLDQMRRTIELTGRLSEASIPPPVRDRLLRAFRRWRSSRDP
jgi:anti-sigma factor RsiW